MRESEPNLWHPGLRMRKSELNIWHPGLRMRHPGVNPEYNLIGYQYFEIITTVTRLDADKCGIAV